MKRKQRYVLNGARNKLSANYMSHGAINLSSSNMKGET